eukprot:s534_g10.t1
MDRPLAVKGAPTPKGSPCLVTPPPKAYAAGVFTPTPPTKNPVEAQPKPSTKVELPTPSMAARLRQVPRPSAKVERPLLPDLEVVCIDVEDAAAPTLPDVDSQLECDVTDSSSSATPMTKNNPAAKAELKPPQPSAPKAAAVVTPPAKAAAVQPPQPPAPKASVQPPKPSAPKAAAVVPVQAPVKAAAVQPQPPPPKASVQPPAPKAEAVVQPPPPAPKAEAVVQTPQPPAPQSEAIQMAPKAGSLQPPPTASQAAPAATAVTAAVKDNTTDTVATTPAVTEPQATSANPGNTAPATAPATQAVPAQLEAVPAARAAAPEQRSVDEVVRAQLEKLDDLEISNRVKGVRKHCLLKEYLREVAADESYPFGESDEFEELVCFETWLRERQPTTTAPTPLPVSPAPKAAVASPKAPPAVVAPAAKAATVPKAPPTRENKSTTSATQLQSEDPQTEFGVPSDILDAWKQAVQSKSRNAKNALFNAFLQSGKNWGQLLGWRTRDQLMILHGNNTAAVDSIIDQKTQSGECRPHPDCPDEESATLYYCMVDLSRLHEDEVEERTGVSTDVALDLGSEARYL